MSAFLTLDSVSLDAPDGRRLFDGLTLAVGRERIGLVGRNGCGKSTLLHLIAGNRDPAGGAILRVGRIGMLEQIGDPTRTIAQAIGVADGLACLGRLEAGTGSIEDAAQADWSLQARVEEALAQVALRAAPLEQRVAALSGGERTRVALARLLIAAPDVLLLDEPTNNLDADGRAAVAQLLEGWRGGAVVASHDRALLERMDRIVELSPVGVTVFGGAWSEFAAARDAALERAAAEVERAGQALRRTERDAQQARERQDHRDKAGRAKRARGDAPKILLDAKAERADHSAARGSRLAERQVGERAGALDQARARLEVLDPVAIDLPKCGLPAGRALLALDGAVVSVGARVLFGPLSVEVRGPARIAVRGANGSGKTTLLRLIAGEIEPTQGTMRRLSDRLAVLDQHVGLLDPGESVFDNLRRLNAGVSDNAARSVLARFGFRNRAAMQAAGSLSGGERMRAGLACVFAPPQPPELLLLDEPTNHLDLATVEALEIALAAYDGALIVVSHDERFLSAIGIHSQICLLKCSR